MGLDAFRTAHGTGANGLARVEAPLEEAVPVHEPEQVCARPARDQHGRWRTGARHDQQKGGLAKRDLAAAAAEVGLSAILETPELAPHAEDVRTFVRAQRMRLAVCVGGGQCGPGPTRTIVQAALQDAAGKVAMMQGKHPAAVKYFSESAQTLSKAYVMAAHEAKHAPPRPDERPFWVTEEPK